MHRNTVLHLIDTGGPGGAETIFLELVRGLDADRWRSIAAVPVDDWLARALRARGVEPLIVPTRRAFDVSYLFRLLDLIRREGVDLIHAHLLASSVYGSLAARLAGIPLVCTFHGTVNVSSRDWLRGLKFRIVDRRRSRVTFVSEALRQSFLGSARLDPERTGVIHNGIDTRLFRPGRDAAFRAELGLGESAVLVGAVGNVRPSKDYANLLRAAALLRWRSAAYRFVVVGQPDEALCGGLLALRRELGLEDAVAFTGFREDVQRVMAGLDIYVTSSSSEGFSLTTVQALACGVPVVATRCGGPEEILEHDVTGLLVPARSPAALADGIHLLATDAERRRRFARAGRALVERRFTLEAMVRRYAGVYEELLRPSGRSGRGGADVASHASGRRSSSRAAGAPAGARGWPGSS